MVHAALDRRRRGLAALGVDDPGMAARRQRYARIKDRIDPARDLRLGFDLLVENLLERIILALDERLQCRDRLRKRLVDALRELPQTIDFGGIRAKLLAPLPGNP